MKSDRMVQLSVIIVSYKNEKVITDCLDSILKYNDIGEQLQVIVVEQSSDDSVFNSLKSRFKDAKFINIIRHENLGFGSGNNFGFRQSSGEFLLFLNPDTILVEPVFKFAIDKFQGDHKLGLFGVHLIAKDGTDNLSYNYKINFGFWFILRNKLIRRPKFNGRTMYINGADLFLRRDIFVRAGMFDENIFMYGEEPDLCTRIKKLGYDIKYFPQKRIIHLEGKSTGNDVNVYERLVNSFIYVSKKHKVKYKAILNSEYHYYKTRLALHLFTNDSDEKLLCERTRVIAEALRKNIST